MTYRREAVVLHEVRPVMVHGVHGGRRDRRPLSKAEVGLDHASRGVGVEHGGGGGGGGHGSRVHLQKMGKN